jgi:hypothetical protein
MKSAAREGDNAAGAMPTTLGRTTDISGGTASLPPTRPQTPSISAVSKKRRGGAWTEAARNDEVACGLPREGVAISAAPERIEGA